MSNFTIYSKTTGEVLRHGSAPDEMIEGQLFNEDEAALVQPGTFNHYVDLSGEEPVLVEKPPSPGQHYDFNIGTLSWSPDLERAIKDKRDEIDSIRITKNTDTITLNGVELDADDTAQKNLANKVAEVSERIRLNIPMPTSLLVWNDFNNNLQTFTSITEYNDWLSSFVIALSERGTLLYVAAWTHKAAINALTTVEAVASYDTSIGW